MQTRQILEDQRPIYSQLVINPEAEKTNYQDLKKNIDKEVKIYINILSHEKIKRPINKKG